MIDVRPCRDEREEEVSLAIYNEVWPWDAVTMDEVRSFKSQALEYADHLGFLDGDAVGSVAVARMPSRPEIGLALLTVRAPARRRGVGTSLYRAASSWFRERGVVELDAFAPEDDEDSVASARRRGFREVERNGRMILELAAIPEPAVDAPPGIEIVTWAERPELARGMYEVACEALPDVPGEREHRMEPFGDWLAHDMEGSGDRPEATFVALAGDEVVGYAKFSLTAAQPGVAHHDMTGVKRAWRGRGVAGALKRTQIAWAKRNGYERLVTQNEMRNEPIRRLNERLGYRAAPGRVILRGPITAASS